MLIPIPCLPEFNGKQRMNTKVIFTRNNNSGFTLIELMISLAIGLFLLAGVFTVYMNSNQSQRNVEDEVAILDNGRFALETIGYDLKHSGMFGRLNEKELVTATVVPAAGECQAGWVSNKALPVFAIDDSEANSYAGTCATDYVRGDIIEMRYSLFDADLTPDANTIYIYGDVNSAEYMQGGGALELSGAGTPIIGSKNNYQAVSRAYYIGNWSYEVGDGIPSLRQVSLQPGPTVTNTVLLPGVEDLQVQFGIDTDNDGAVNTYANPSAALDWDNVVSAQIWVIVRGSNRDRSDSVNTAVTFSNTPFTATNQVVNPNDGFRRSILNSVVQLRELALTE